MDLNKGLSCHAPAPGAKPLFIEQAVNDPDLPQIKTSRRAELREGIAEYPA